MPTPVGYYIGIYLLLFLFLFITFSFSFDLSIHPTTTSLALSHTSFDRFPVRNIPINTSAEVYEHFGRDSKNFQKPDWPLLDYLGLPERGMRKRREGEYRGRGRVSREGEGDGVRGRRKGLGRGKRVCC